MGGSESSSKHTPGEAYASPLGYCNGALPLHDRGYLGSMNEQYLIMIEQLHREGRSEREIEKTLRCVVDDDRRAGRADQSRADHEPVEYDRAA